MQTHLFEVLLTAGVGDVWLCCRHMGIYAWSNTLSLNVHKRHLTISMFIINRCSRLPTTRHATHGAILVVQWHAYPRYVSFRWRSFRSFAKTGFYMSKCLCSPELFKKVFEYTMTPAGIDTAKLYPILISSGLPREALGQIWALANRTTPGKLTKEELYTVLALIGVAQVMSA